VQCRALFRGLMVMAFLPRLSLNVALTLRTGTDILFRTGKVVQILPKTLLLVD
jgi:hypothetical protein